MKTLAWLLCAVSVSSFSTVSPSDRVDALAPPTTLPREVPVAVVGGGLGGLAVCAALRRRGVEAHLFEAAPTLLDRGSTGTGIMISKNGMRALDAVDPRLPDAMRGGGSRIVRQSITRTDPVTGATAARFSFNMTEEQINVGWSKAQELLADYVDDDCVHCNARFLSYRKSDDGGAVDVLFEDGRSVRTRLLIGADGAGSAVRRVLAHKKTTNADKATASYETRYNGQLLWNAIVPSDDLEPPVHGPGEVEYVVCGNDGQVVLTFDAGEERTSWYLTLMEDKVKQQGGALAAALHDGAFGGFGRAGVKAQLEEVFAAWPSALACLQATPEARIFERRLSDRPALFDWTDPKVHDRVVLLGDAAHPMIPSQGQGTMMTWEDAADLAACVAGPLHSNDDGVALSRAVRNYVSGRATRCAKIQRLSANTYMGRQHSNFLPRKVVRMLGLKRRMEYMKDGYTPVADAVVSKRTGFRAKLRRLFKRH